VNDNKCVSPDAFVDQCFPIKNETLCTYNNCTWDGNNNSCVYSTCKQIKTSRSDCEGGWGEGRCIWVELHCYDKVGTTCEDLETDHPCSHSREYFN
jgi:hypothetical protein